MPVLFCVFQPDGNVREKHLMKSRACRFLWKPRGIFLVMDKEQQMRAPVYEALEKLKNEEWCRLMCRDIREEGEIRSW